MSVGGQNAYSKEQSDFIYENYKGVGNKELAQMFNDKFGTNKTPQQISSWKASRKLDSGLTGRFKKGHIPINKGTKGMFNVGGNKTSFKKGQRPANYKPIGHERVDKKDGYVLVKVQDEGTWPERWKLKHRVLWEKHHGPIPDKHRLIFLNGNRQDIRLDNLALTSYAVSAVMNKNGLFDSNPDITKIGINIAKLATKTSPRAMEERNKKRRARV